MLTLYQVKKDFKSNRSEDSFAKGQQMTYLESTLNHFDGIEICSFRDFNSEKKLIWHADEIALEKWYEYFQVISFPK